MLSPKKPRAKSFRGIFVGYKDRQHVEYRVYLPEHKSFIVSFHVDFSSADDIFKKHQNKTLSDKQVELLMKSLTQSSTPHTNPPTSIPLPTSSPVNENETLDTTRQEEVPLRPSPRLQKPTPPNTSDLHLVALEDIQTLLTLYPNNHYSNIPSLPHWFTNSCAEDLPGTKSSQPQLSTPTSTTGSLTDLSEEPCRSCRNDAC